MNSKAKTTPKSTAQVATKSLGIFNSVPVSKITSPKPITKNLFISNSVPIPKPLSVTNSLSLSKPNSFSNSRLSTKPAPRSLPRQVLQNPQQTLTGPFSVKYNDDEPLATTTTSNAVKAEKITSKEVEESLKLTLRLKKKIIQSNSFSSQTFPMLASIVTDNLTVNNKAPLDLVCVIDRSGSMRGQKIELVRDSFNYLLNFLGDSDRLSIIIFDDNASRLVPLMRTTEENKKVILCKLKDVYGNGGTDINLGMTHAFEVLKQRRYKNSVTGIFLLSDGLDYGAQQKVRSSLAKYNLSDDITISTFGFGKDHDPQLMNDIADLRDGNFYFVEKLNTVDEAFVDCLGGLLSSVGQNVVLKISPEQSKALKGFEIVKAYGEASMWAKDGDTFTTRMSSIISGRQRDFVLELRIPANSKELQDHQKIMRVASAEVTMIALDGKPVTKKAELFITMLNETEEFKDDEESNREVMKNFYRVKGASILGEARKLADQRQYNEAKKLLQNFKEEIEGCFLKNEEFIRNLIVDIHQAIQDVDPIVYEQSGKHNIIESTRSQMHQKVSFKSANSYQNSVQMSMLTEVRTMKSKK